MHEGAVDQATGLRRVMSHPGASRPIVVNLLGAGDHPAILARLVQIWADQGLKVAVVTDFDRVFQAIQDSRRRFGLTVLHASASGLARQGIERLAAASDLTFLALDDYRLAHGFDGPATLRMVLSGTSTEAVATSYVRLKATSGLGSSSEVCTLFDRGGAPGTVLTAHRRFAHAATRFLGIRAACAGVAPEAVDRSGWAQLAGAINRWAIQQSVPLESMALH